MLLLLSLLTTFSVQAAPATWSCGASGMEPGFNGGFGRRREINGPEMPSLAQAQSRAVQVCMTSGLLYCGVTSCSQIRGLNH